MAEETEDDSGAESAAAAAASAAAAALTEGLREIEATLNGGTLGVAATYLPTGGTVTYNADTEFPTASVIKIAIVTEVFLQAARSKLPLDLLQPIRQLEYVAGSGVLAHLSPGRSLSLRDLATLTIALSDNTASNICLARVGGPAVVNKRMKEAWGMKKTVIHRPIKFNLGPDDPPHTATGTPRDMLRLVHLLAEGTVIPRPVAEEVLRRMSYVTDADLLPRYLEVNPFAQDLKVERPPFIVRHKPGAVNGVRNDAGLITRGGDNLAVCVYTKNVPDPRWTPANAASEAVARAGQLLSSHFFGA